MAAQRPKIGKKDDTPGVNQETKPSGTIRSFSSQNADIDEITESISKQMPVKVSKAKKKPGRKPKFKEGGVTQSTLLPHKLNALLENDAKKNAADNISATLCKIVAAHYGFDLDNQ